jgi:hypothetical protein
VRKGVHTSDSTNREASRVVPLTVENGGGLGRAVEIAEYPRLVAIQDVQSLHEIALLTSHICRGPEVDVNGH